MRLFASLLLACLLLPLMSCGGGGGTTFSSTPIPSPGPVPGSSQPGGSLTGGSSTSATFVYVATNVGIDAFRLDSSGTVTAVSGSPFVTSAAPATLSNSGTLMLVTTRETDSRVLTYRIDASTGVLTLFSDNAATLTDATFGTTDSTGRFFYVGGTRLYGFTVDSTFGTLTPIPGSPWFPASTSVRLPKVSPDGSLLCAVSGSGQLNESLDCFPRDPSGVINPTAPATAVSTSTAIPQFQFSPGGGFVALTNADQDGVITKPFSQLLTSAPATVFSTGGIFSVGVAVDPSSSFVAVTNFDSDNVSIFSSTSTGDLSPAGALIPVGAGPNYVAFTPNGRFLIVSNSTDRTISIFSFDATGTAIEISGSPVQVSGTPSWILAL